MKDRNLIMKKYIQYQLTQKSKLISFHEKQHEYYFGQIRLVSVTTSIKKFIPEFNKNDKISQAYAQKHGLTNEVVKEMWQKNCDDACILGTDIHNIAELSLLGLKDKVNIKPNYEKWINQVNNFIEESSLNVVSTETILFSHEFEIAGQADFITIDENGIIDIWDWKTSKQIVMDNPWNRFMLGPLSHLPDTNFTKYSLQLSVYRKMLEDWGLIVNKLNLVHISEQEIKIIPCPYLKGEAEIILNEAAM